MQIDVAHIARLARLELTDKEKELFGSQLNNILTHIEQLNRLDTSDIEPTSHVLEITNVLREDRLRPSQSQDEALSNAPDRSGDHYRVPRIIE